MTQEWKKMIEIVKTLYIIFLMTLLCYVTVRVFIVRKIIREREWLITLLIVGASIVIYVRFIVHDLVLTEPSDEALYVSIIREVLNGMNPPTSGPGFVYTILFFESMTGWSIETITALFGLLVGSAFLVVLYLIFRIWNVPREEVILSTVLVLSTSYLLWPMIEARPQQIGMLLVLAGGIIYYRYMIKGDCLVPFMVIFLITFIFHILSFIVLGSIVLILWWSFYLQDKVKLKKMIWPTILFLGGLLIFISPLPLYSSMNGGVRWMFRNSHIDFLLMDYIIPITLSILIITSVFFTIYVKRKKAMKHFLKFFTEHANKFAPIFIVVLLVVLTTQFLLNRDVHTSKYRGSMLLFLFMQVGNMVFGALFLKGYFTKIRKGQFDDPFFRFATILMLMGAASILLSLFLPINFNNWSIRIMNYWTLFAVPIVTKEVMDMHPRWRSILTFVLPIVIMISLINISRDQTIFGYP